MWDDIYGGTPQTPGGFVDQEYDLPLAYDPSGTPSWDFQFGGIGSFLKNLGLDTSSGNVLKSLGSLFTGSSDYGKLGQFAGFGGLAALMNRSLSEPEKIVGYQGGIPLYTATRTQTPIEQQRPAGYRPGQGGITYFAPTQYAYQGRDIGPPTVPPAPPPTDSALPGGSPTPETETVQAAAGGKMDGGIAMLAKGRYLKGDGDGVSDDIPARFAGSGQPAALADGEFVIPARVVAEIGNGSSDAGAKKLYAMLDRVEARARKAKRGKPSGADRELNRLA